MAKVKKNRERTDRKARDLTMIIEQAFEAGFLSLAGPYSFRAPEELIDEIAAEASSSSARPDPISGEISLA